MKKIIAVLLSVIMLFGCMAITASAGLTYGEQVPVGYDAAGGTIYQIAVTGQCEHHLDGEAAPEKCNCCVFCPNIDSSYFTGCADAQNEAGETGFDGTLCCVNCDGIWPCDCGCHCCGANHDLGDLDNNLGDYITEEDKENFVDGFQAILKQISDIFDKFFDAIFEFLRLDEILGRN